MSQGRACNHVCQAGRALAGLLQDFAQGDLGCALRHASLFKCAAVCDCLKRRRAFVLRRPEVRPAACVSLKEEDKDWGVQVSQQWGERKECDAIEIGSFLCQRQGMGSFTVLKSG